MEPDGFPLNMHLNDSCILFIPKKYIKYTIIIGGTPNKFISVRNQRIIGGQYTYHILGWALSPCVLELKRQNKYSNFPKVFEISAIWNKDVSAIMASIR